MRMIKRSIFSIFLSITGCNSIKKEDVTNVDIYPLVCESKQGLHLSPDGEFGVFVFCDDAAGTTIGIINIKDIHSHSENVWKLEKRFWQEESWCRDVIRFQWAENGKKLIVETNYIYGSGQTYELDLINKKVVRRSK